MKNIGQWLLVLALINLVLLILGWKLFFPKKKCTTILLELQTNFRTYLPFFIIIIGVVLLHLLEVNILDLASTQWIHTDFTQTFIAFEGDIVARVTQYWTPALLYFFVFFYIGIYPFLLWFSPLFYIIENNKKAMKTFAYGLLIIYAVVLPFNLFFPVTNVYTYYQLGSTLEYTIPTIEQFFYKTTTYNNSFPSLHVALSLLLVRCATLTKNKRFQYFSYCCAGAVIVSVIYLAIHWITDVIGGIILTSTALFRPQLFSAGG